MTARTLREQRNLLSAVETVRGSRRGRTTVRSGHSRSTVTKTSVTTAATTPRSSASVASKRFDPGSEATSSSRQRIHALRRHGRSLRHAASFIGSAILGPLPRTRRHRSIALSAKRTERASDLVEARPERHDKSPMTHACSSPGAPPPSAKAIADQTNGTPQNANRDAPCWSLEAQGNIALDARAEVDQTIRSAP